MGALVHAGLGANATAASNHGWAALHPLALGGHKAVVGALVGLGANATTVGGDGWAALHCLHVAQGGHKAVVGLGAGATEAGNNYGSIVLHCVALPSPSLAQVGRWCTPNLRGWRRLAIGLHVWVQRWWPAWC